MIIQLFFLIISIKSTFILPTQLFESVNIHEHSTTEIL